jgi:O-antigen/teichoic acid export membrane protein
MDERDEIEGGSSVLRILGSNNAHSLFSQAKKRFRSYFKPLVPFYLIKPLSILINFITIYIITKKTGMQGYGTVSLIVAITSVIMLMLDFRTNEATVRFYLKYKTLNEFGKAKFCILLGGAIDLTIAIIFGILMCVFSTHISHTIMHDSSVSPLLLIYALGSSVLFIAGTPYAILQSCYRFWMINVTDLFQKIVRLAWIYFFVSGSLDGVVLGYVISNVAYFLLLLFLSLYTIKDDFTREVLQPSKEIAREFFSFTSRTFFSNFLKAAGRDVDKLILGYFTDAREVGVYDIIKRVAGLLSWLIFPLANVAYPYLVRLFHTRQYGKIKDAINLITVSVVIVSGLVAIFVFAFQGHIYNMFHFSTEESYSLVLGLLLFGNICLNALWWCRVFVNSINEPGISVTMNFLRSLLHIGALIALTKPLSILGASMAMTVSSVMIFFAWAYYYLKKIRIWRLEGAFN